MSRTKVSDAVLRVSLELAAGSPWGKQAGREGGSAGWEQCLLEAGHRHPALCLFPSWTGSVGWQWD